MNQPVNSAEGELREAFAPPGSADATYHETTNRNSVPPGSSDAAYRETTNRNSALRASSGAAHRGRF